MDKYLIYFELNVLKHSLPHSTKDTSKERGNSEPTGPKYLFSQESVYDRLNAETNHRYINTAS